MALLRCPSRWSIHVRGGQRFPDCWDFPGGHLEFGEDAGAGAPANLAPEEHDALRWVRAGDIAGLQSAHSPCRELIAECAPTTTAP